MFDVLCREEQIIVEERPLIAKKEMVGQKKMVLRMRTTSIPTLFLN